jgi:hypothetical protein
MKNDFNKDQNKGEIGAICRSKYWHIQTGKIQFSREGRIWFLDQNIDP